MLYKYIEDYIIKKKTYRHNAEQLKDKIIIFLALLKVKIATKTTRL